MILLVIVRGMGVAHVLDEDIDSGEYLVKYRAVGIEEWVPARDCLPYTD